MFVAICCRGLGSAFAINTMKEYVDTVKWQALEQGSITSKVST